MIATKQQMQEMYDAATPLIKWLCENTHPHCEIIISRDRIKLTEELIGIPMEGGKTLRKLG